MSTRPNSSWRIVTALYLLGAVPALPGLFIVSLLLQGPGGDGASSEFVRAHYFATPAPIILHAMAGFVFAALVPLQFSRAMARRWPRWHRKSGRVIVLAGTAMALSAFWMLLIFPPAGGTLATAGLVATGFGMLATLGLALHAIIWRRDIERHRIWMMRTVAVTYGAIAPALLIIPYFLLVGDIPDIVDGLSRWVGAAANLAIVQWTIRKPKLPVSPLRQMRHNPGI